MVTKTYLPTYLCDSSDISDSCDSSDSSDSRDSSRAVARLKSLQNSGAFRELFWVLLTQTEKFCTIFFKFGSFSGAFLGAFDKYVEILCYFGSFSKVLVAFGSFLGRF